MTRLEKFIYAKDTAGWTCSKDGLVYNKNGKKIGSINGQGYLKSTICLNKTNFYSIKLHQFIFWYFTSQIVPTLDHIDGDKLNNCIDNLRAVSIQQNSFNQKRAKGFCWHKRDRMFVSTIKLSGKTINLGMFHTKEEARQAYLEAKKIYHKI